MRVLIVFTGLAAIMATADIFCKLPYLTLIGAPWLTIALLYLLFRGSSYRDLKDLGRNLSLLVTKMTRVFLNAYLLLLKIIVGDRTWDLWKSVQQSRITSKVKP